MVGEWLVSKLFGKRSKKDSAKGPFASAISSRAELKSYIINELGIFITGPDFDSAIREYNRFEMPIGQRLNQILNNKEELVKFETFIMRKFD